MEFYSVAFFLDQVNPTNGRLARFFASLFEYGEGGILSNFGFRRNCVADIGK